MNVTVADTGLFVALFDGSDRHHAAAKRYLKRLRRPLMTNLPVITETVHLLDFHPAAGSDFLTWVDQAVHIDEQTRLDWPRIVRLMDQYSDLPTDFADASLVALCERLGTRRIATLDGDFEIYRPGRRKHFQVELLND